MARSILMPPDVDPEQPHISEQIIRIDMQSCGHVVVSSVANPVVVDIETTWKDASLSAVPKEVYCPLAIRSVVMMIVARQTKEKKTFTVSDFQK